MIPTIESRYTVAAKREHRAIGGYPWALANRSTSDWGISTRLLGSGRSPRPNTRPPAELVPDAARKAKIKLLFISCGNRDGLIRISQGVHAYLKEKEVSHIWHVDGNAHDPTHWRNSLYHFVQRIFK